ncbi:MAG: glycosyltransferase family 2 protein [Isosphaeraceae bacterium]|jgi:hypothetical protein
MKAITCVSPNYCSNKDRPVLRVDEADVSVLIPTYRRGSWIESTVRSALSTGAGEVIVSDDASDDDTVEALRRIVDPRLLIVVQPRRLGLWPNHRAALLLATRPWIKFLQDDDWLAPDSLRQMLAHVGPETTIVSGLPIIEDWATGERFTPFRLEEPVCWSAGEYLPRFVIVGNSELGNPSCTLFRSDLLDRSEAAWADDMSWDLVANVLAAARGEVVLLPPGLVTVGQHHGQDTHQQSIRKFYVRFTNTINYLRSCSDTSVRGIAERIACAESLHLMVMTGQQVIRFRRGGLRRCSWSLRTIAKYYAFLRVGDIGHALSRFRLSLQFWGRRSICYN